MRTVTSGHVSLKVRPLSRLISGWGKNPRLRAILGLGRVSNLPTIWSNCLAAWILGAGGIPGDFLLVLVAASLVYLGGMYLNDAFDEDFDRQHRRERPIPAGIFEASTVWHWGFAMLGTGTFLFVLPGGWTAVLGLLLAGSIILYDAIHKVFAFSHVIIAACRWLLFLTASSLTNHGIDGAAIWTATALAGYVVGLSYLARRETIRGTLKYWPVAFLGSPLLLAALVNNSPFVDLSLFYSVILLTWIALCLRFTFRTVHRQIGRTVAGLLAGIPLVDCLSVLGGPGGMPILFFLLFLAALTAQRTIPAT